MKTYKIDSSKISEYTKRNDNRVFKILAITMVAMPFLMFPVLKQERAPKEVITIYIFSFAFTALIVGLIYLNNKKLTRLTAENLQIVVDDHSITRVIDLDNEPRLNFFHRMAYDRVKNISGGYYAKVDFDNIKSIEKKSGDLWVKATNSNAFNGKNIVLIPRELTNFDDIEKELNNRRK